MVRPTVAGLFVVGLFVVGLCDPSSGSNVRMMDDRSECVATLATGRVKLPDTADMQRAIRVDRDRSAKRFPNGPRYGLGLDPHRYRRLPAREHETGKAA